MILILSARSFQTALTAALVLKNTKEASSDIFINQQPDAIFVTVYATNGHTGYAQQVPIFHNPENALLPHVTSWPENTYGLRIPFLEAEKVLATMPKATKIRASADITVEVTESTVTIDYCDTVVVFPHRNIPPPHYASIFSRASGNKQVDMVLQGRSHPLASMTQVMKVLKATGAKYFDIYPSDVEGGICLIEPVLHKDEGYVGQIVTMPPVRLEHHGYILAEYNRK